MLNFGGFGVAPTLKGQITTQMSLLAGQTYLLKPNRVAYRLGTATFLQEYDQITKTWKIIDGPRGAGFVTSDGNNYRIANLSGCVVGVNLTAAGSGFTSVPTVTASAGNSIYQAIVGGAVNTSVTVTAGGKNYTYTPQVSFSVPPSPGIPATGYCTLTNGVVTSVTITNQGAGYTAPPTITFINDPREGVNGVGVGSGAAATATLTGSGTVTGILVLDHGTAQTSVPTLTISGGGGTGATAIALMAFAITEYTVTTAGAGYTAPVKVSAINPAAAASAYTNPASQANCIMVREANITGALSSGAMTATGQVVNDGGIYTGVPTPYIYSGGIATTPGVLAAKVGGVTDTVDVLPT